MILGNFLHVVLAGSVLLVFGSGCRGSEPEYDGHSLSYWVNRTDYVPVFAFSYHGEGGFNERKQAFDALAHIGAPAVSALVAILLDRQKKWDRRWNAVLAIQIIGQPALNAAPALRAAFLDPSFPEGQRYEIPAALMKIGACAQSVPELTAWMAKTWPRASGQLLCICGCAKALASAGPSASSSVSALVNHLRDPANSSADWFPARREICAALGAIGVRDAEVLDALRATAGTDSNATVRAAASEALSRLAVSHP